MTNRILGSLFAATFLLMAGGANATFITYIDIEVKGDNYEANTPEDTSLQDLIDDYNNNGYVVCDESLEALDMVGSVQTCGGPNSNIATWFTVDITQDSATAWQFGADWGRGGAIWLSDGASGLRFAGEDDYWWALDWNNPDVINFEVFGTGSYTLNLLGFEGCCGGAMSLRWAGLDSSTETYGDYQIARVQVPEPSTLALLGIGIFGMGLVGRRRKA